MLPMGFEPTISAGERPLTYALDRGATGIGTIACTKLKYKFLQIWFVLYMFLFLAIN